MSNQNTIIGLDSGGLGLTLPIGWKQWIFFVFGLILFVGGLVTIFIDTSNQTNAFPIISALGALIMGFVPPTKLQQKLQDLRLLLRPTEVQWKKEEGGTELHSFWNSETINKPTTDPRSWVFPAPPPNEWHLETKYHPDESGELLAEHPNKIGTPRPPAISNYGLATSVAFALFAWQMLIFSQGSEELSWMSYVLIGVSMVWLLVSFFMWKRAQAMQDTPTSNIRSVAVGTAEIVGQARPGIQLPALTVVDADPSKSVADLLSWHWKYEVYKCRTVKTDKGTREQCSWETVRQDTGGTTFTIHDGTGGLAIHPNTFETKEYGDHLIQWECRHNVTIQGLLRNIFSNGRIKRHRWTLWGLKIGDPCYLLATMQTRSSEDLESEGIDRTLQNALLEAVGEKAPGFKPRLEKGTELTALAGIRSQLEYLIIPTLALLASIIMLGV